MTDSFSIRIYVNIIENIITFKIKTGNYLKLLTPKTMKLPESAKSKIIKAENGENVPHLEITEVGLIHFFLFFYFFILYILFSQITIIL